MGKFMPFKKKGGSNQDMEGDTLPESPDVEVKKPARKKKKKGKKNLPHDSKTTHGKVGAMLKGKSVGSGSISEDIFGGKR